MRLPWRRPLASSIRWGRWCTPTTNVHCDPDLKGALADRDNHLCDGRPVRAVRTEVRAHDDEHLPWKHPTLLVFASSYGV